jgi:hypothetical protein
MKERPINLTSQEVNAVREGRKTQKRFVVKLVDTLPNGRGLKAIKKPASLTCLPLVDGKFQYSPYGGAPYEPYPSVSEFCPYGKPGDRLWVRETWRRWDEEQRIIYKADYQPIEINMRWKSPACMPKEASRITLEITAVRVERLQEISEEEAEAEGVYEHLGEPQVECDGQVRHFPDASFVRGYLSVWQSIHGPGSWDANPFVWVLEFKRVEEQA